MAHLPLQVAPTLLCGLTQPRLPAPEVAEWTGSSLLHRSSWSVSAQFCHPESVFFPRAEAQQGCPASGPPFPCPLPWALAANSHGRALLVFPWPSSCVAGSPSGPLLAPCLGSVQRCTAPAGAQASWVPCPKGTEARALGLLVVWWLWADSRVPSVPGQCHTPQPPWP